MAQIDLLTPVEVKKAKTTKKVEYMPDGRSLYLRVRDNGEKYFIVKLYRGSKIFERGIGNPSDVTLAQAREERDRYKALWKEGKEPSFEKKKNAHLILLIL